MRIDARGGADQIEAPRRYQDNGAADKQEITYSDKNTHSRQRTGKLQVYGEKSQESISAALRSQIVSERVAAGPFEKGRCHEPAVFEAGKL